MDSLEYGLNYSQTLKKFKQLNLSTFSNSEVLSLHCLELIFIKSRYQFVRMIEGITLQTCLTGTFCY